MQIDKILGVNCLVNALVLSSLHLVGAKQGDTQLTVVGLVVATLFFFVTKSQPLNKLSPQRPPSSVLWKQVLLSIVVQFLVHFVCIMAVTFLSKCYLDPFDPSLVPDGHMGFKHCRIQNNSMLFDACRYIFGGCYGENSD